LSNEKAEFAKLVDASATMGANLTLAMGKKILAAAVVKLSGLCFISEIIERHPLVCCSCVARPEYEGSSYWHSPVASGLITKKCGGFSSVPPPPSVVLLDFFSQPPKNSLTHVTFFFFSRRPLGKAVGVRQGGAHRAARKPLTYGLAGQLAPAGHTNTNTKHYGNQGPWLMGSSFCVWSADQDQGTSAPAPTSCAAY
jgi:hypothetical protein